MQCLTLAAGPWPVALEGAVRTTDVNVNIMLPAVLQLIRSFVFDHMTHVSLSGSPQPPWADSVGATTPRLEHSWFPVGPSHGRETYVVRRWMSAEALGLLAPAAVVTCSLPACRVSASSSASAAEPAAAANVLPLLWAEQHGRPLGVPDMLMPPSLLISRPSNDVTAPFPAFVSFLF